MVRVVLLLAVVGGLVLFLLQNSSVVLPLTILGIKTVALPVAVWVLGAIAAGAVTALLTGALVRLGGGRRASSRRRSSSSRNSRSGSSGTPWTPPPWTGRGAEPQDAPRNGGRARSQDDDWGASSSSDDWDDWARGEDAPRTTRPPVTPPIRDAEFRPLDVETVYPEPDYEPSYSNSYEPSYSNSYSPDYGASAPDYYEEPEEREVWDDWEDEPVRSQAPPPPPPPEETPPARDIVEIRRDPQSTQRTGTIYSFSYRAEEEPEDTPPAPSNTGATVIQEAVIETPAEEAPAPPAADEPRIRVIIPPYRSTPEPPPDPEPPEATDDWDDNGEDFDADDSYDEGATDSDVTGDREVWDDWDEGPDEPDSPGGSPPPRSPNGNPPLKF